MIVLQFCLTVCAHSGSLLLSLLCCHRCMPLHYITATQHLSSQQQNAARAGNCWQKKHLWQWLYKTAKQTLEMNSCCTTSGDKYVGRPGSKPSPPLPPKLKSYAAAVCKAKMSASACTCCATVRCDMYGDAHSTTWARGMELYAPLRCQEDKWRSPLTVLV